MKLMRMRASHWAIFLAACLFMASCEQDRRVYSRETELSSANKKSPLAIKSVELVEQDLSLASSTSKKLEEWKDSGDPKLSKLPVFEVVVMLQNISDSSVQDADFIALTTIDFVISPTYLYQGDVRKILQNGNWGRLGSVSDVKMETVPYVKPGEGVEVRIKGFNLSDLPLAYNGQDHTLWPWALRVNVHVMNREMRRVAFGQATLRMIPADNRLRAK